MRYQINHGFITVPANYKHDVQTRCGYFVQFVSFPKRPFGLTDKNGLPRRFRTIKTAEAAAQDFIKRNTREVAA